MADSTSTCLASCVLTLVVYLSWVNGNSLLTDFHIVREGPQALLSIMVGLPWHFADGRLECEVFVLDGGDG